MSMGPTDFDAGAIEEGRREEVRRRFARGDSWFATSPLYRELARTVAADDDLVDLAARTQPGQQPANMLMAAVHLLVLEDPSAPLARFYPSGAGEDAAPPDGAGPVFAAFCRERRAEIETTLRTRLVQTNVPGRAVAVRLAMAEVGHRVGGAVTFLEVGPSAGIQLRFDRWAVEVGGRRFGPDPAPLTLRSEWRGEGEVPDLGALPPIGERLGVDLHPVDATDPAERLWLKALVWPEHRERFAQLEAALDVVAADPLRILAGDATAVLPCLDPELPDDVPLVVFHAMVRIHVEPTRRAAFDAAIEDLGRRRRLFHVSLEIDSEERRDVSDHHLLALRDSEAGLTRLARCEGHGRWIAPFGAV